MFDHLVYADILQGVPDAIEYWGLLIEGFLVLWAARVLYGLWVRFK